MTQLTKREDQIMQIFWRLKKAFIREVVEELPDPRPHYNTVATLINILVEKGALQKEKFGNTYQYSSVEAYREAHLTNIKKKYFGGSFPKMIAYFAKDENLSEAEIEELIKLIKSKKD